MGLWSANWYVLWVIPVCRKGNWMTYCAESEVEARAKAYDSLSRFGRLLRCLGLMRIVVKEKQ